MTGAAPPAKPSGVGAVVIVTSGTSCVHWPWLPGVRPIAAIRCVIYATALSPPGVPGLRPSNASDASIAVSALRPASVIPDGGDVSGGAASAGVARSRASRTAGFTDGSSVGRPHSTTASSMPPAAGGGNAPLDDPTLEPLRDDVPF